MSKSYRSYHAALQPDQTACWSTTMAWWTRVVRSVPNFREIDILGMYSHLTGTDGGLRFPDGFRTMLEDSVWGLTVFETKYGMMGRRILKEGDSKGPILCGYWDSNVNGYHAVALYGYKEKDETIWAMDPNPGMHIQRPITYYFASNAAASQVLGYIEFNK